MFSFRVLLIVAGPLVLGACDDSFEFDFSGPGSPPDVVVDWEGTVTSSVDGTPIADVSVDLFHEDTFYTDGFGCAFACRNARTDSVGFYSMSYASWSETCFFDGPERVFVQACAEGEKITSQGCTGWQESERVYVTSCEPAVQHIDFVLDPVSISAASGR